MVEELSRYCHAKGCRRLDGCPRKHKACEKKLGLDTAIAWTCGLLLKSNDTLKEKRSKVYVLLCAVTFHITEYMELTALLGKVLKFLDICIAEEREGKE
ncbi:MAG: hypothetical protein QXQ53_01290 [Candidatus Methanosuratincola sp.]